MTCAVEEHLVVKWLDIYLVFLREFVIVISL